MSEQTCINCGRSILKWTTGMKFNEQGRLISRPVLECRRCYALFEQLPDGTLKEIEQEPDDILDEKDST